MRCFLALLLIALPIGADELVLKDGKRVEWTSLKDLGESFEVESKGGVKLEVKKSDVARIEFRSRVADASDAAKSDAVLTGNDTALACRKDCFRNKPLCLLAWFTMPAARSMHTPSVR